jgi:hypothetical protein
MGSDLSRVFVADCRAFRIEAEQPGARRLADAPSRTKTFSAMYGRSYREISTCTGHLLTSYTSPYWASITFHGDRFLDLKRLSRNVAQDEN